MNFFQMSDEVIWTIHGEVTLWAFLNIKKSDICLYDIYSKNSTKVATYNFDGSRDI